MANPSIAEHALWLRNLPARTALKLFNRPGMRQWLARRHDDALRRHEPHLPRLSGVDAEIVSALNRDGMCITSLEALQIPGSDGMVRTSSALSDSFAPTARALSRKGEVFLIVPPEQIASNPVIYNWGLHDRLLDIVEAYIGLPVAYDGVAINYTVADGREISTRKWHRDWEDRRMLKVAVYLHDVDDEGGPFQQIRRNDAQQDDSDSFNYALADDAELERRLGAPIEDSIISCEGVRGTVIFCDTARLYHRGKPATRRDRAALFFSYFANPPRHPFLCERTGLTRSHIARLARRLPERQRNAALWRKRLPGLLRLVPPATI